MNAIRTIALATTLITAACTTLNPQSMTAVDASDGTRAILIDGDIEPSDASRFLELAEGRRVSMVALDSYGGDFKASMMISIYIKKHNISTYLPTGAVCASACAMVFLSGAERSMQPTARVGLHPPTLGSPLGENREHWPIAAHQWYQLMLKAGLPRAVVESAAEYGPRETRWLHDSELAAMRVKVEGRT